MKVTTVGGTVLSGTVSEALGRTGANPLPVERLREKFENCIGRVLPSSCARTLADMIERLETLADMRELSALLCGGGRARNLHAIAAPPSSVVKSHCRIACLKACDHTTMR